MISEFLSKNISTHNNGLIVLGLATGAGKTTAICDVINNHCQTIKNKKFYYITDQHINIKSVFNKILNISSRVYLKSRKDLIIDILEENNITNFSQFIAKIIPDKYIRDTRVLSITKETLDIDHKGKILDSAISEIREVIYQLFLDKLKIKDDNNNQEKYKQWLKTSYQGKKISQIFPEILLDDEQVVVMTTKRMMSKFSYLYKSSKFGWEHIANDKNAVIFFDESDAVANTIQQSLFENTRIIDLLGSMRRLSDHIYFLPQKFKDILNKKGISKYAQDIIDISKKLNEEFGFKNTFYIDEESSKTEIRLFKYLNSSYMTSKDFYIRKFDDDLQNYIYIDDLDKNYDFRISDFISRVINFIDKRFVRTAYNYARLRTSEKSSQSQQKLTTDEQELKVFLDYYLGVEESSLKKYIFNSFNETKKHYQNNILNIKFKSFYEHGLDITNCTTANISNAVNIYTHRCFLTKEKILQKIAKNNLVFCVSATAEVYNPMVNFDLDYLKKVLGDRYITIPLSTKHKLTEYYNSQRVVDNKIKTSCITPLDEYGILDNIELRQDQRTRYKNCFGFIKAFAESDSVVALAFFNKSMSDDISFQQSKIEDCLEEYGLDSDNLIKIDASSFRNSTKHNDRINQRLQTIYDKGLKKKLLIVTAYGSAATGINIHYDKGILECGKASGIEIDIDMLYLDGVTNLLPNNNYEGLDRDQYLIAALYAYTYLYENCQLSYNQYDRITKSLQEGRFIKTTDFYCLPAVNNRAIAILIQAIGRISRTDNKRDVTRICYSEDVRDIISRYTLEDFLVTREFKTLYENITSKRSVFDSDIDKNIMDNHVYKTNFRARYQINGMLMELNNNEDSALKDWQVLREVVLKNPTINNVEDNIFKELYIDTQYIIPEYRDPKTGIIQYKQDTDYKSVELVKEKGISISDYNCGLDKLMSHNVLRKYFQQKGYATSIDTAARYIMSPIIYNNIYKGALGEAVVEFVLTKLIGCELEFLPAHNYEAMDFKVLGKDIYIDAKLHRFSDNVEYKDLRQDLLKKSTKLQAEKLIIINVYETETIAIQQQFQAPIELENGVKVFVISWLINRENEFCDNALKLLSKEVF